MKKIIILILLLQLTSLAIFSQNTMWLTNGEKITIGEYEANEDNILIYKKNNNKVKNIEIEDIFSIIEKSGNERIFYIPDTSNQDYFTISQMRQFVKGRTDARNNYNSKWTTIGGIVIGAGSVIGVPLIGLNSLYAPIFPLSYNFITGLVKVKKEKIGIEKQYLKNKHYVLGFEKSAKQKRIKNSLFGTGIGIAVGIAAVLIFVN